MSDQRRYASFSRFLVEKYGERVNKISVDAGLTCPNRDGRTGVDGCVFCRLDSFSQLASLRQISVQRQIEARLHADRSKGGQKFIVYFQASTNTYAPIDTLRSLFFQAISYPGVVGIAIATRPDCLAEEIYPLLQELSGKTDVWVELGLQSVHDRTLQLIRRGHTFAEFAQAVAKLSLLPIRLCCHLMLGLPGEDHALMMDTAEVIARMPIQEVKIHPLLVLKETAVEQWYREGKVRVMALQEYVETLIDFIERLPAQMVLQRLTAEAPADMLVAPLWSLQKAQLLQQLHRTMERRNTWQGRCCQ